MLKNATGAALATIFAASALFSVPAVAQDTVTDQGSGDAIVQPLTTSLPEIAAGDAQWIAINWTALNAEAREFKVTAVGSEGVKVGYPAFPVDGYSSGYWDDTLSVNETDYTALRITVTDDAPAQRFLRITVRYVSDTGNHEQVLDLPFEGSGGGGDNGGGTDPEPTPAPDIVRFILVNPQNDTEVRELVDGDVIDLDEVGRNRKIAIRAIAENTESVQLTLDGVPTSLENHEPYALFGDVNFDYRGDQMSIGDHTLTATPYSEDELGGVQGATEGISFTVQR